MSRNTILISGTAQTIRQHNEETNGTVIKSYYNVHIWGSLAGDNIEFIKPFEGILNGYDELWRVAKQIAVKYFSAPLLADGCYTVYLDHLITRMPVLDESLDEN